MSVEPKPPVSNRGVQNTCTNPARAIVDWVSFTFSAIDKHEDVIGFMGYKLDEFLEMEKGMLGYMKQFRRGHIIVLSGGRDGMGVHVIMTGQGCREFEQDYKESWHLFFKRIFNNDGHFTRIDLAIDDFLGYVKVQTVLDKLDNGLSSSRFKTYRSMKKGRISDGGDLGKTIYIGSQQSDIQIRIYDKLKERLNAKKKIDPSIKHWARIELQMQDKRADRAAHHVINAFERDGQVLGYVVAGILRNYISFFEKKLVDTNKSRWTHWKRWARFLGKVEKLPLTLVAPDATIEKSLEWVDKQVSKTIAKITVANRSDGWLRDIIENGQDKFEEKDWDEINAYRRRNGENGI